MGSPPSKSASVFLDTIQEVPQLLHCVTSHCGVKVLRLLCKEARKFSEQAITSYTYSAVLSSQASKTEPLLHVATFLQNSRLQRLRVELSAPAGTSDEWYIWQT